MLAAAAVLLAAAAPRGQARAGEARAAEARAGEAASCSGGEAAVAALGGRAVDGTILELAGGGAVRLAGIAAAQGGHWAQAAREALDGLVAGSRLKLTAGPGNDGDRYGRVVAQVFAEDDEDAAAAWVQGALVARGLARVVPRGGEGGCGGALLRLEAAARAARRGLWRDPGYAVRRAGQVEALVRLADSFQIVEGQVRSVGRAGSRVYVNFGRDWRRDFTLVAASARLAGFRRAGVDLEALAGRRVRVRGWLERRGGPMIEVEVPEQVEVIAEGKRLE